jgi:hypothetical protein
MRKAKNISGLKRLDETKFKDNRLTPRMERRFEAKEALKRERKKQRDANKWPSLETNGLRKSKPKRSMKPPLHTRVIRLLIRMLMILKNPRKDSRHQLPPS